MAATIACPTMTSPTMTSPKPALTARYTPVERSGRPGSRGPCGLGGLRLTRRGRLVVFALAVLFSLPLVGLGGRAVASDPGRPVEVTVYTVAPGDTLWRLATQVAGPGQDVREVVADLQEMNELKSVALSVGQTILLPKD